MTIRRVCVYCGSRVGGRPEYAEAAQSLGEALLARDLELVYGGANVGLMAAVADAVLEGGGRVTGVIPQGLERREVAHSGLTDLRVVSSMHERKSTMASLSDAFVSLPGGIGTFEETLEMMTWAQLGIHNQPCGLINVSGFYDGLLNFLDHSVKEGFMDPENRELLMVAPEAGDLLDLLEAAYGAHPNDV